MQHDKAIISVHKIDSSSMQHLEASISKSKLIAVVCSMKQGSVCTRLIAVVGSMTKQVSLYTKRV